MRNKLVLLSALLTSCSYLDTPVLSPYKMDIRQGNFITPEMREQLKPGMTKSQVRYVLGTPLIYDAFHGNRWDYTYRLERHGEIVEKQDMTLYFNGDNLTRVIESGKTIIDVPVEPPVAVAEAPVEQVVAKADPAVDVLTHVKAWATAWSAKNAHDYFAAYTPDFKPDNMSHAAWEKQRLDRISRPKEIEIGLDDIQVAMLDAEHATVSFSQRYRSDNYRDVVDKTLALVKRGDAWLIASERAGKPQPAAQYVAKPAAQAAAGDADVGGAIKHWAEAWAARDVAQYLASYADTFKPAGMSKAKWQQQREQRIGKANSISVDISALTITQADDTHASATFKQDYRSDSYHDSTRKLLKLEKIGGVWLIVAEQAAK